MGFSADMARAFRDQGLGEVADAFEAVAESPAVRRAYVRVAIARAKGARQALRFAQLRSQRADAAALEAFRGRP